MLRKSTRGETPSFVGWQKDLEPAVIQPQKWHTQTDRMTTTQSGEVNYD